MDKANEGGLILKFLSNFYAKNTNQGKSIIQNGFTKIGVITKVTKQVIQQQYYDTELICAWRGLSAICQIQRKIIIKVSQGSRNFCRWSLTGTKARVDPKISINHANKKEE
ncbi:MAG: hypothetical protein HUJ51_02120 [Eggerthellaceae bacterium]|nr:hypothetical protein [Eggerthellaceae bacterium]